MALKILELTKDESLKSLLLYMKLSSARRNYSLYINALYNKYEVDDGEYGLDLSTGKFVVKEK